jgi:hypothetical protein
MTPKRNISNGLICGGNRNQNKVKANPAMIHAVIKYGCISISTTVCPLFSITLNILTPLMLVLLFSRNLLPA